jgi:hypothetical protein
MRAGRIRRAFPSVPPTAMHKLLELNLMPDFLIRRHIRSQLAERLREEDQGDPERQQQRLSQVLGRHLKYSCTFPHRRWDGPRTAFGRGRRACWR